KNDLSREFMAESLAAPHHHCHLEIISNLAFTRSARYDSRHPKVRGIRMRKLLPATLTIVVLTFAALPSFSQAPTQTSDSWGGPVWANPSNWHSVKAVETDNIVYSTVPRIPNLSAAAAPDPGTPSGIRTPVP